MNLYIMRHGQAQLDATSDHLRALTQIGVDETTEIGTWFNAHDFLLSHVIVSPYVRAQQTSQRFLAQQSQQCTIETSDGFTPNANAKLAHDFIDASINLKPMTGLLIVAHMPLVSYLIAELTGGAASPLFETAAIAVVDYNTSAMRGTLTTLMSPELTRQR